MLKMILLGSIMTLGLGTGASFARERTISVWGHQFTLNDTQLQPSVLALAPPRATADQGGQIDMPRHRAPR